MFCYKCGKEISDNSEFCQFCGVKIKKNTIKKKQTILNNNWFIVLMTWLVYPFGMYLMWSKKKFNLLVRIILSVFFGFIFIGFLGGVFSNTDDSKNNEIKTETTTAEEVKNKIETERKEVEFEIEKEIENKTEAQTTKPTIEKTIKKDNIENIIKEFNETFGVIMKMIDPCIKTLNVEKKPKK